MVIAAESQAIPGCDRSSVSAPSGFAICHADFARFSFGNDSGKMKNPYSAFAKLKPAAAQNGARKLICPRNPPTAGPTTNPNPNTAPTRPKLLARFSGAVTSVTYANADDIFDVVIPEIIRPTNSQRSDGASAIKM